MSHLPGSPRRHPLFRSRMGPASLLVLALGGATGGLEGCTGWQVEPMPPVQLIREQQPDVVRLDRASDTTITLYTPIVVGDTLRGLLSEQAIRPVRVPLSDIRTISTKHFRLGKTLLLFLAVGGGVALFQLLQGLNQGPGTSF